MTSLRRLTLVAAAACAVAGPVRAQEAAGDTASPMSYFRVNRPFSAEASARRDSIVARARSQLGTKYRMGATGGSAFDCSGFVRYVLGAFGVQLPRTSTQQATVGQALPRDTAALRPGDLLTFGRGKVSHVGIYVGDGRYVHASSYKHGVVESSLARDLARGWWKGARRFFGDSSQAPTAPAAAAPAAGPAGTP